MKPESPWGWVLSGMVIALIGGFVLFVALSITGGGGLAPVLYLVAAMLGLASTVMIGLGVIAAGVRLGMRWAAWEAR